MIKKIVFWIFTIAVGFVNPLFSVALVVLYYLPKIIQDACKPCNEVTEPEMKLFSDGFPIGYGIGIVILPLSTGWIQEDPLVANMVITFVYAIVGFTRSYFLRRTFEKYGIEDNFIKLGIKLIRKIIRNTKSIEKNLIRMVK